MIYISRWLWCPDSERFSEQPTSISNRPALSKHVTLDGPSKVIIYSSSQCQHNPAGAQIFYTTLHKETKCACNNTIGKYFWFSLDKPLILQWFHSPWREELRRPLILSLPLNFSFYACRLKWLVSARRERCSSRVVAINSACTGAATCFLTWHSKSLVEKKEA